MTGQIMLNDPSPRADHIITLADATGTAVHLGCFFAQARDARDYARMVPSDGQIILYPSYVSIMAFRPVAPLAALTITTPSIALDSQVMGIFSTEAITALTWILSPGQLMNHPATSLAALTGATWIYGRSNDTWDRIG